MDLYPWVDDSEVIIYSSRVDLPELVEIWANRNGMLYAKITCPKDRVASITLGKIDLPPEIKKLGKKIFRSSSTKWLSEQMKGSNPILRFGSSDSFHLSFKLCGRNFERGGKFRQ